MGPDPKSIHINGSLSNDLSLLWRMKMVIKKIISMVVLTNKSRWKVAKFPTLMSHYIDQTFLLMIKLYLTTQIAPMASKRARYSLNEERYL